MRVHTLVRFEWDGQKYVEVYAEGFEFPENGNVDICKGATQEQKDLASSQTSFYNTLTQDYNTQFANQGAILSSLNQSLSPTVAAGPSQFGFSPGQVNNLNSTAIQGTAQQYQNAQKALQNTQAAQGGGNMMLPSGVAAQNNATLAATGANQTSSELLGIQNAGYTQGNQNYNNAVGALGGVASQYNPNSYASNATGSGNAAANELNTIQQENTAASPLGILGGVLGGAFGAVGKGFGAALGNNAGSNTGTFGSSAPQTNELAELGV